TIFATNTSCLSITQLGACTQRAHKVVGMHFFNPAHVMKLVEIVPGLDTSPETVRTAIGFGELLGKLAIRVDECPSFLVNRLLGRYMNEALWCLQEGTVSQEEIDQAATEFVMPIGPFALRDMNGADVGLAVASLNYQEYGERFRPAPLLEAMVKKNLLGQKTGEGFYLYDAASRKRKGVNPKVQEIVANIGVDRLLQAGDQTGSVFRVERLFLPMINEAFLVLQEKICDAQDLDPALMAGLGMRKGPLTLAAELGLAQCLSGLEVLFARYGERFRPASLLKRYVWAGHRSVL
ncbi:MAG: 3-hydroxyacyl-CoA dehydrogenase, partial [Candidatus Melainabacteria bacterium]|nr:3-hydroxyacyl-CoA dehydrogenase [Candidatus Melainabacteria bacterium]